MLVMMNDRKNKLTSYKYNLTETQSTKIYSILLDTQIRSCSLTEKDVHMIYLLT